MMNIDFFSPVDTQAIADSGFFTDDTLNNRVLIHTKQQGFPSLADVQIVIFGVKEDRGAVNNVGCGEDFNSIRAKFYQLYPGNWSLNIADLGDIEKGNSIEDTYFAVSDVVSSLIKNGCIPVIIGGGQDLTYAVYRAYDVLEQTVNLVSVDSKFDLGSLESVLDSSSFLSKIVMREPNNLFNYSNLGYQTYFNSQEEIKLLGKLYFDAYRLGELKNLEYVEPVLRDADIISFDLGSLKYSEAPASYNFSPNGFTGEQACAIARYAGISDKVSSFGVYEYNPYVDVNKVTASLLAQMLWYFIEGVNNRAKDYPFVTKDSYQKFTVLFEDDDPINFYKSDKSGRWWMEISVISDTKYKRHSLIPCTYQDYKNALAQKVPQRWYNAQQKLI